MTDYYKCDSCGYETDDSNDLPPFKDFLSRVTPGEKIVMPIGDCPDCGAFCYIHTRYYNHAFTIAFTVVSKNDREEVTVDEFWHGLKRRIITFRKNYEELEQAANDLPYDSYPTGHEEFVQWRAEGFDKIAVKFDRNEK